MRIHILSTILFIQLVFISYTWGQKPLAANPTVPASYVIQEQEIKLYDLINEYRASFNLPPIPLSRSLSYVAHLHVQDLIHNRPDRPPCNFHSWSNKGNWKPFCYPTDEKKNNSVWDKPKELTGYKGKGYEIIYWENNPVIVDSILPVWSSIDYFNSFLLNTGKWQEKKWLAIGIGIFENYASAWFGEVADVEEKSQPQVITLSDSVKPQEPEVKPKPPQKKEVPAPPPVAADQSLSKEPSVGKSGSYYIIVSSQQPRAKSSKLAEELKAKGYPDAKVLAKDNKVRVSIIETQSKAQADSTLKEIKKLYKDAWILKW